METDERIDSRDGHIKHEMVMLNAGVWNAKSRNLTRKAMGCVTGSVCAANE